MGEVSHSKPRHLSKADVAVDPRLSGCPLALGFGGRGTRDGQRDFTALSTWAFLHLQLSKPMGQASLSYLLLHNKFLHSICLTQPTGIISQSPGIRSPDTPCLGPLPRISQGCSQGRGWDAFSSGGSTVEASAFQTPQVVVGIRVLLAG